MNLPNLPNVQEAMGEGGHDEEQQRRVFFFTLAGQTEQIVTAIAEGLSIKDLKIFRPVSKFFYRASLTPWRRRTVLTVYFESLLLQRPLKKLTLKEALDLPIRKDDMLNLGRYPPTRFQILYWEYYVGRNYETVNELIKQFFIKWGSSIRHLDLRKCDSVGTPSMIQALKYARNLKTLALNDCNVHGDSDDERTEPIEVKEEEIKNIRGLTVTQLTIDSFAEWKSLDNVGPLVNAILNELPLLKELNIHLHQLQPSFLDEPHVRLLKSLQDFRKRVGNDQLQVKIRGIVEFNGSVDELLEATLPLERWHTGIKPHFQYILRMKARKLGQLFIHQNEIPGINVSLPEFPFDIVVPVLRELSLIGKITNSFNFLNFMPSLKCVKIQFQSGKIDKLYSNDAGRDETKAAREKEDFVENTLAIYKVGVEMEYLEQLETDCFFKMESLPVLKKMIPNLTVLKMVVQSNEMFRFICENWPNLIEFCVKVGSSVDDSGITGVEHEKETMQYSNLTSLRNLKRFEISSTHVLTDRSVNQSFARMKNLTKLLIRTTTNFSDSSRNWLDDNLEFWDITPRKSAKRKLSISRLF